MKFRTNNFLLNFKSYLGPVEWPTLYAGCNGDSQSPIDIQTASAIYNPNLTRFAFNNPSPRSKMIVINNGHSSKYAQLLKSH